MKVVSGPAPSISAASGIIGGDGGGAAVKKVRQPLSAICRGRELPDFTPLLTVLYNSLPRRPICSAVGLRKRRISPSCRPRLASFAADRKRQSFRVPLTA